jgi:hypothetical protein
MTISVFSQAISAELGLNDVEALHDRLAADFAVPAN